MGNLTGNRASNSNKQDREKRRATLYAYLFVNPKVDEENKANITCDIETIRPDGSLSIDQHAVPCYQGKIAGSPFNIRLSAPIIKYTGEAKDLAGKWTTRVTLKDNLRHVQLALKASFILK